MSRGLFISVEGGEGAGKTLQCRALVTHLERLGYQTKLVREPGETGLGQRIRKLVLFTKDFTVTPEAEALLFTAARAQLTCEIVRPTLDAGAHVVADRFFDSTLAYQGFGRGADLAGLLAITRFAVADTVPDLTFLLDVPVDVAASRLQKRSPRLDRIESFDRAFHSRVREGYLSLAKKDPKRWLVIDATRPELHVSRLMAARVDEEIERRTTHRIAAH